jgi:hypothetical protein
LQRGFSYHYFFAAFLLFAFLAQHFSAGFIMVDYVLRTEAYAKYCINKAKPAMQCKGKCQMMRKMAEQEKQSPMLPESPSAFKLNIWCQAMDELHAFSYPLTFDPPRIWAQQQQASFPPQSCSGVFHPPRLVA